MLNNPTLASEADPPVPLPADVVLLLVAVTAGVVAQGGYYPTGQRLMGASLVAALGCLIARCSQWTMDLRSGPIVCCALLIAWTVISAAVAGHLGAARSMVAVLVGVVIVLLICARTSAADRHALGSGLVAVGAIAAITGWFGVAWRFHPWALEDQALWRAATSLTYANAAAGLLVPLAILALARLVSDRRSIRMAGAACVLLAVIGASASRAGFLALALGATVLAALVGPRRFLDAVVGPAVGAVIVLAGLAPSMPDTSHPQPTLAVAALIVGLAVTTAMTFAPRRTAVIAATVAAMVSALAITFGHRSAAVSTVRTARLTMVSPDRFQATQAAFRIAAAQPLLGTGPGQATLSWTDSDGRSLTSRYAHNEYVQTLAELGAVGLLLVLATVFAAGRSVRRGRLVASPREQWAGVVAGSAALALHSAFDFLWHVPVIPLVGAALVGIGSSSATKKATP